MNQSKILIMCTLCFEQSELEVPLNKLRDAEATVHVATPDGNFITKEGEHERHAA
uniref:hypothetical protein n=1 Tax=Pararhizobium sp. IMCC3301 TaxID=3067904 RepID=UPI002740F177|nr:hypothetical protein [Pararhizobium sp. IMCC3301]